MVADRTVPATASRLQARDQREELNDTADRLAIDVVEAYEDGCSAVPESQRLIAWILAEFLPYTTTRYQQPPQDLSDLLQTLEELRGAHGAQAAQLSLQSRSLVFRLL